MPATRLAILLAAPLMLTALPAHAYIGPGAGAGLIAVVLGILAAVAMAFLAILWYPLKRLFKRSKGGRAAAPGSGGVGGS